ncbi:MAG TPA: EAL domain-containing protein [Gallionella sp.]|nr:EAL domain-containing protein [Gallionella sp.]
MPDKTKEVRSYFAIALLVCGLALAAWFGERLNNEQSVRASRVVAQDQLGMIRSRLEGSLYSDIQLVKGLVSVIAANPGLGQAQFSRAAKPLFDGSTNLRNIGAAPNMVIRMMYPVAGNEKAIGLDYRNTPSQFEMAEKARTTGKMILAGPLVLAQGGTGIIGRIPVFTEDPSGRQRFWGLISAVIDADKLYLSSGMQDADSMLEIAIRGKDGTGSQGEVFFGRPELFDADPVLTDLALPVGSWQIAAVPRNGWSAQAGNVWELRLIFLLVGLLIVLPVLALIRSLGALSASEFRFRQMFENHAAIMLLVDPESGEIIDANPAAANFYGYPLKSFRGMNIDRINSSSEAEIQQSMHRAFRENKNYFVFEHRLADGSSRTVEVYSSPMISNNKKLLFSIIHDISIRKQAEMDLRVVATAFESQEGILITDAHSKILRVNNSFTEITGYSADEVLGKNPRILNAGLQDAEFYRSMWDSLLKEGSWAGEVWNRRKSGEIYPEYLAITAVKNEEGVVTNYVASLADISQRKESEEKIRSLAFYDPLTRLPNRRLLLDRLQQALVSSARSSHRGALLFLDLDNFKSLNDTLGHDIGDVLLQQVAQRLASCVREGDTVARLGGDEFVVVLEDLSKQTPEAAAQTEDVCEKILANLNQPYQLGVHEYACTSSIGATLFNGYESEVENLLKQADIAMYQAKKAGRNNLRFFDPAMQSMVTAHVALEADLRRAVSEQEQFQLYYQPQVDSAGHILGVEALVRWHHPERGMVSPAEFIPLAEESGLILPLGHWVLITACGQLAGWAHSPETAHLTMAVNVSAKQFALPTFVEEVLTLVEHFRIDPARLKLEITESMLAANVDELVSKMTVLKASGINFSLDDFGTGYSSLQYLKRLPLDQLKIDQSFVRDIVEDNSDRAIVKTIIAMARSMDLDVIAEGVETEEQRNLLLHKGCSRFQGYLFCKPVPIEQFEALLKRGGSQAAAVQ